MKVVAGESNVTSTIFDVVAQRYIESVNAEEYRKAAKMFHFPENMDEKAKQKEIRILSDSLGILVDELGSIDRCQSANPGPFYSVFIMAGSLDYWSNKMDGLSVAYIVQYQKKGEGYLIFRYAEMHSRFVLRAVEFGLPRSRPDALGIIERLIYRIATEPDRSQSAE